MTRTILIIGASGGIGSALADRYHAAGCNVIGTYRAPIFNRRPYPLLQFDFAEDRSIARLWDCVTARLPLDTIIFANGHMMPIGPFATVDAEEWTKAIYVNALAPLELLREFLPLLPKNVCFFSGAGTNSAVPNYSAYVLGKILLIKAVELLHAEIADLNAFVVGPGYVETPIHEQTLRAGHDAGLGLSKLQKFQSQGPGTSMDDIFACIEWCVKVGREVMGGRNISVRDDPWRDANRSMISCDDNHWRLRRQGLS